MATGAAIGEVRAYILGNLALCIANRYSYASDAAYITPISITISCQHVAAENNQCTRKATSAVNSPMLTKSSADSAQYFYLIFTEVGRSIVKVHCFVKVYEKIVIIFTFQQCIFLIIFCST